VGDDSSEGTSSSFVEAVASDTKVKISAMFLHPKGEAVFCGKGDGSVCLYDLKTGAQLGRFTATSRWFVFLLGGLKAILS
jgi:hypothetical protein